MIDIKFMAWKKSSNKMLDVGRIDFFKDGDFIINDEEPDCELMQYARLKDKNGKDVYFGHFVHLNEGYGTNGGIWEVCQDKYGTPQFKRNDEPFKGVAISFKEYFLKHEHESHIEIIGNVYESPDLLSKEQNVKASVATEGDSKESDDQ